jgi:hypothetical protein
MKGIICKPNERLKYSEQGTDETIILVNEWVFWPVAVHN